MAGPAEIAVCPGCGSRLPAVEGPVHAYMTSSPACWAAFNAVTQVEGRIPPDAANNKRRFHSAYFGGGRTIIRRAEQAARALVGV